MILTLAINKEGNPMNVKFVSITKPAEELTAEQLIVYCARVSNPKNQNNMQTAANLIEYCLKHKHWSVFEMVDLTVEIKTSRDIAMQLLRHKSFVFQQFSHRYSASSEFERVELRKQATNNRQSSIDVIANPDLLNLVNVTLKLNKEAYEILINAGVARETARAILPGCTATTLYMKGSVRSWIHYLNVRLHDSTQKEHRDVATAIYRIFKEQFPTISLFLEDKNTRI